MKFETLSMHHTKKLLDFEQENRAWFESLIEARDNAFYTEQGVAMHIESLSKDLKRGTGYSGVLMNNNRIVGRANLKDIASNTATVGYRIAQNSISQGFASYCLTQLLDIAQSKFGVKHIKALVLENNPASMHVLEKHHFKIISNTPNYLTFNNKNLSCTALELTFI